MVSVPEALLALWILLYTLSEEFGKRSHLLVFLFLPVYILKAELFAWIGEISLLQVIFPLKCPCSQNAPIQGARNAVFQ